MENTDENPSYDKENIDIEKNPGNNRENGGNDSNDSEDTNDLEICVDLSAIKKEIASILEQFRGATAEFESRRSDLNLMTDHGSSTKVQEIIDQFEKARSLLSYIEHEIQLLEGIDDSFRTSTKRVAVFTEERVCENINREIRNINEILKVVQGEFRKLFGIEKFFKNL